MRCICGKSESYTVTLVNGHAKAKHSGKPPAKDDNQNLDIRTETKTTTTTREIGGVPTTDPIANGQPTSHLGPPANTTKKFDDTTRYVDTSKTVSKEYTNSRNATKYEQITTQTTATVTKPELNVVKLEIAPSKPAEASKSKIDTTQTAVVVTKPEVIITNTEVTTQTTATVTKPELNIVHLEIAPSKTAEASKSKIDTTQTAVVVTKPEVIITSTEVTTQTTATFTEPELNIVQLEIKPLKPAESSKSKINTTQTAIVVTKPEVIITSTELINSTLTSTAHLEVTSSKSAEIISTQTETSVKKSEVDSANTEVAISTPTNTVQVDITPSISVESSTTATPEGILKKKGRAPQPGQKLDVYGTLESQKSESSLLSVPTPTDNLSRSSSTSSLYIHDGRKESVGELLAGSTRLSNNFGESEVRRRSGVQVSIPTGVEVSVDEELPVFTKTPKEEEKIKKAIEKNEFLSKILLGKRLQDIINAMQLRNVAAKKTLIKQGETGSEMYVSSEGKYKILVKGKMVGEFNDTRVFGELAILYKAKRLATIQAVTAGKVWVIDRDTYLKIVIRSNLREQDENLRFLQNVESLNVVNVEVLRQVSNLLKPEFFAPGTVIIRQGDKGDKFYIIRAGIVTISKTGEGVLGKLGKGQCFGEMALQKEDTRQATVIAEAPGVECLTLTRRDFINHFGDVAIPKIEVRKVSLKEQIQSEYQDIKLEDLKIIKTLGVGGFGRVELVQHKKHKSKVFALKYLKKIDIVYQNQQEHVYNEKMIQMNCRSPFIVRLYRTFKDNKYVYFLMESCLGGDLFSLLHKQKGKRFEEKDAKFLSACVIEALEHLHSKGIVYRDLKPENLLIDKNGYLKLTDFGFAKKMPPRGKTFTFAGTPEYVAPEIVLNRGHDKAVDYWAFGAFVFELLTGKTPFRTGDSSHMRTYNKILNGIDNVNFPTSMNPKARNLIEKLCRPVPAERLGMQRGGTRDIKTHKWYQGFDWQKFQQLGITPPFKPKLKDSIDTSNFDLFKQDKDYPPDETSGWDIHF